MAKGKPDLLHGTLDLLILRSLDRIPMHGWAISKHIQALSEEVLEVNQGSLYPALYRLEGRGWIAATWEVTSTGRRARGLGALAPRPVRRCPGQEWQQPDQDRCCDQNADPPQPSPRARGRGWNPAGGWHD